MDHCDELLQKAWEGEILGRTFFSGLADAAPTDAPMWELMVALESATAAMIEPIAAAHGVVIDEHAQVVEGEALVAGSRDLSRDDLLAATLAVIPGFLEMYRELATVLPPEETWLGDELVEHEQALAEALDAALHDRPNGTTRVVAYLARRGIDAGQPA